MGEEDPPIQNISNISNIIQVDGNDCSLTSSNTTVPETSSLLSLSSLPSEIQDNSLENSWFSQLSNTSSQSAELQCALPRSIPVLISVRQPGIAAQRRPAMYRVLRRENRCEEALNLPRILSYNMRSIWGKTKHLADDIHERAGEIIFLSEVWEKSQNKKHQYQIEKMFEMENISYISTPRPGIKRGGGAAIAICTDRFSVSKLNINIPKPLEIVWALLKPIVFTGEIRKIILCSFYSPPRSRKNAMLIDHISLTYNSLKILYPDACLILSGDKNSLDERSILALNTNFRQMVQNNTRKDKSSP